MSRLRVAGIEIAFERLGLAGPVIVFEAGLGEDIRCWEEVARLLSACARLVISDRPGIGRSGPRVGTRVLLANTVVEQLAGLLQAIAAPPPYILVGHSLGGFYMQAFARNRPQEVAAVVLIDSASPFEPPGAFASTVLPRPGSIAAAEEAGFAPSAAAMLAGPPFPPVPLIVLAATDHDVTPEREALWQDVQAQTAALSPRDIDLLFVLPLEVYYRFQQRQGNVQSQLLQEVRDVLRATYWGTDIRGDRQVVVIPFGTYQVEVAPAFHRQGGGYLVCDTSGGGRYKHVDPYAELAALTAADSYYNGNVRKLTRLLKQWQRHCNVPIKSFHLEAAIKGLLPKVTYAGSDEFWFDWLVRDAFAHLTNCANESFGMPVTGETIAVGDQWLSRAQSAYERAAKACSYEYNNEQYLAGAEWQKIFGPMIPAIVSPSLLG